MEQTTTLYILSDYQVREIIEAQSDDDALKAAADWAIEWADGDARKTLGKTFGAPIECRVVVFKLPHGIDIDYIPPLTDLEFVGEIVQKVKPLYYSCLGDDSKQHDWARISDSQSSDGAGIRYKDYCRACGALRCVNTNGLTQNGKRMKTEVVIPFEELDQLMAERIQSLIQSN